MAAVPWPRPFEDPDWCYELKWDGIRALLAWDGERSTVTSRRGNDLTGRYPEFAGFAPASPAIVDGEIVAFGEDGLPSFERLQARMHLDSGPRITAARAHTPVTFVAFDVLVAPTPVMAQPWTARRALLDGLDLRPPLVRSEVYPAAAPLWEFVRDRGMEGIVAKRTASTYRPGTRSPDWRKIAAVATARAVVIGSTPGSGGRSGTFGALLLGLATDTGFRYIGSVGSGFSNAALRSIREALDAMPPGDPGQVEGTMPRDARLVPPVLVALVQYREWTAGGRLRAPSFKGFTDDPVGAITWEAEGPGT